MTNLQEAYKAAAIAFVSVVVEGDPEHIMKKLEQCPILLRNVHLNNFGDRVFFSVGPDLNECIGVSFPKGVRLQKHVSYSRVGGS